MFYAFLMHFGLPLALPTHRHTTKGSNRVNRGGSWNNNPQNCRVANRNNNSPGNSNNNLGFRLANTGSMIQHAHVYASVQRDIFLSR
jgi:Sulfatase-modifying factor enzyme 1